MDFLNWKKLTLLSVLALILFQPAAAQSREYKLKAAFVFNFIKFVEWPNDGGSIKVGILGNDPFQGELEKLETREVDGRTIKVIQLKRPIDAKSCQVVFTAEQDMVATLLKTVNGLPVLTVSDLPGFSKEGGCITLMSSRNRIRFSINTKTLKSSGLKASSKLLSLAENLYSFQRAGVVVAGARP